MDSLCGDLQLLTMFRTSPTAKDAAPPGAAGPRVLRRALHDLDPNRAWQHPVLFLLETIGALLALLAFRDAIVGASLAHIEAVGAGVLWIGLLLVNVARVARPKPRERVRSSSILRCGRELPTSRPAQN